MDNFPVIFGQKIQPIFKDIMDNFMWVKAFFP